MCKTNDAVLRLEGLRVCAGVFSGALARRHINHEVEKFSAFYRFYLYTSVLDRESLVYFAKLVEGFNADFIIRPDKDYFIFDIKF